MPENTVALAADHAGYELKNRAERRAASAALEVLDLGTHDGGSVDYPDMAGGWLPPWPRAGQHRGVLVCGTGIGISIAANRHPACPRCVVPRRDDRPDGAPAQRRQRAGPRRPGGRGSPWPIDCLDAFLEHGLRGWPAPAARRQAGLTATVAIVAAAIVRAPRLGRAGPRSVGCGARSAARKIPRSRIRGRWTRVRDPAPSAVPGAAAHASRPSSASSCAICWWSRRMAAGCRSIETS